MTEQVAVVFLPTGMHKCTHMHTRVNTATQFRWTPLMCGSGWYLEMKFHNICTDHQ